MNLAYCYERGIGCNENKQLSLDFYEKAAKLGNEIGNKLFEIKSKNFRHD